MLKKLILIFIHLSNSLNAQSTRPLTPTLSVSPAGELTLTLDQRPIATGHWMLNSSTWQASDANQIPIGDLINTTVAQQSPTHVTVTDTFTSAKSTCEFTLEGEDLHLAAHVQNLDTTHTLKKIFLIGPTFHFKNSPEGTIPSWHWTYLQHDGMPLFHPSIRSPLGVVFAHDDKLGIAAYSSSEFDNQSLINALWKQPSGLPKEIEIEFYTNRILQPSQSADVDLNIRITEDLTVPHLLGSYQKLYAQHFPKALYHPDHRLVGQFASTGQSLVTRTNPLGFNGDFRRLDINIGARAYAYRVGTPLHNAGALGIIFWSPGGWSLPMYPPDFDIFPPSVQANIPILVKRFHDMDLRVGLCARCGDGVTRDPARKTFNMFRLNAQSKTDMQQLKDRFDHAIQMGFDLFYLDSFGAQDMNDLTILKKIRQWVGPDVLLYTEYCTDQTLPYADHYCEWNGGILWTFPPQLASLKFLDPNATWLCMSRESRIIPPQFAELGLTPLIQDLFVTRLPASQPTRQ